MTSMNKGAIVLKSDGAGRVQTPADRQMTLVREFERSGLSGPRFAAMAGVKYRTFVSWRRKHGTGGGARQKSRAGPVAFMETVIPAGRSEAAGARPAADLVIELSSGVKLRLQYAAQLSLVVQLLNALQKSRPC